MDNKQRLTQSELARPDVGLEKTRQLIESVNRGVDLVRNIKRPPNLTETDISQILDELNSFLSELKCIQDAPDNIVWDWVGAELVRNNYLPEALLNQFGHLDRYFYFCDFLARLQSAMLAMIPKGKDCSPDFLKVAREICPKAFHLLSVLLIKGYAETNPGSAKPPSWGSLEHAANTLVFLSDIERLRLSDAAQVFSAIAEGRTYYFDNHVCFFHFPDNLNGLGEIAVAVKAKDGLWSYDKWEDLKIPFCSIRALKQSIGLAKGFRIKRFGLLTHRHSRRLSEWMGLEMGL
jgi:hypothetical protein